jgi:adenosylhomocysteine nucleosidase
VTATGLIGVVAALPEEMAPLQRSLDRTRKLRLGRSRVVEGRLGEQRLVTMASGDGATRASRGLESLITDFDLEAIFAIGIAGGLSTDLEVGDVVVAGRVTNGEGVVPAPDDLWRARATGLEGVVEGSVHSHEEIAIDPVAKGRLWEQTGRTGSQVVDLESASYARVAAAQQVPFLVLRAVSDSATEALPLDFNRFRRSDGSSDRWAVARHAILHPSIVPELVQLRERLSYCARRLALLIAEMLSR